MQVIHRPSQMIWAVTMLFPMKAVTRHRGMAHTKAPPTHPTMDRTRPSNCMPVDAMAIGFGGFVSGSSLVLWLVMECHRVPENSP